MYKDFENDSKLPIRTGFILSDKYSDNIIEFYNGHRDTAWRYLLQHNLIEEYKKSEISAEDDYLVEHLGAMKLYHSTFKEHKDLVYVRRQSDPYINRMIKLYEEEGWKIVYCNVINEELEGDQKRTEKIVDDYNLTVIWINGKYMYNPKRIGD